MLVMHGQCTICRKGQPTTRQQRYEGETFLAHAKCSVPLIDEITFVGRVIEVLESRKLAASGELLVDLMSARKALAGADLAYLDAFALAMGNKTDGPGWNIPATAANAERYAIIAGKLSETRKRVCDLYERRDGVKEYEHKFIVNIYGRGPGIRWTPKQLRFLYRIVPTEEPESEEETSPFMVLCSIVEEGARQFFSTKQKR